MRSNACTVATTGPVPHRAGHDPFRSVTSHVLGGLLMLTLLAPAARAQTEDPAPRPRARDLGITIGGSEHAHPPAAYADVYRRAGAAGLGRTVHAGEAGGSANVWSYG